VLAVIGVDTFHDINQTMDAQQADEMAETWRRDFAGSLERMLGTLLHADTDPALYEDIRQRMSKTSLKTVCAMFHGFGGYDIGASVRRLGVPLRCILGDLFPIDVEATRRALADFDAVVLPHTGHYPMLECPDEFNRRLGGILNDLRIG